MSIAPYIVLLSIAAIGVVEAIAFVAMKDDRKLAGRRTRPE
ncbi:MAG TPA: hypothetical protein VGE12_05475 [Noviherbaspirillum sp.]